MSRVPPALQPDAGERGVATADPVRATAGALAAWDAILAAARGADLTAVARAKGRTGVEVVLPLGSWPESRSLASIVDAACTGSEDGSFDQDAVDARVRAVHRDADPAAAVDAVQRARDHLAAWLADGAVEDLALRPVPSVLGPLPLLTFVHAAVYQLAVCALDLEPCGARPDDRLLDDGVVALVDTAGALAARQGLAASLATVLPAGTWGFGSRGTDWRTARLPAGARGADLGPAVEAHARIVVDVTSGRAASVPGLWRRRELVTRDLPGLLRLAPIVEQVPGIPGGLALRAAAGYLGAVGALLRR